MCVCVLMCVCVCVCERERKIEREREMVRLLPNTTACTYVQVDRLTHKVVRNET